MAEENPTTYNPWVFVALTFKALSVSSGRVTLLSPSFLEVTRGTFSHEEVYTRTKRKIKAFWSNKRNRGLRLTHVRNTRIMWQMDVGVQPNE